MACTHPVIYSRGDEQYCHICGAVVSRPAPKPAEPVKHKGKAEKSK